MYRRLSTIASSRVISPNHSVQYRFAQRWPSISAPSGNGTASGQPAGCPTKPAPTIGRSSIGVPTAASRPTDAHPVSAPKPAAAIKPSQRFVPYRFIPFPLSDPSDAGVIRPCLPSPLPAAP